MAMMVSNINTPNYSFKSTVNSEEKSKIDVSEKVSEISKEVNETVDAASDAMDGVTKGAGTLGASAIGLWTITKKPVTAVYNFFTDVVMKDGKPLVQDVFDNKTNEVVEKYVRKANWKKIGIAGAALAVGATALGIVLKAKNDKKAEEVKLVEEAKNTDNTVNEEIEIEE